MNLMCEGDGKKTRGFLAFFFFGLITLGIYYLVWLYMVGDRLHDNAKRYNLTFKEGGGTVLLWFLLGSLIIIGPIIALHIIFKNTNALADEYNKNPDVISKTNKGIENLPMYKVVSNTGIMSCNYHGSFEKMKLNIGDKVYYKNIINNDPTWFYCISSNSEIEGWCFSEHFEKC
jgi:hypothetical protein